MWFMDIDNLISKMTRKEKAALCSGLDNWHTKPIERLNLPSSMMADGPHGLRKEYPSNESQSFVPSYPATCFPTASALASSWNRDLLFEIGEALAEECLQAGVSIILGPGVNIKRSPLCGRNFEYFSEDPFLSGEMAVNHIKGVQSKGIGTSLKHFAVNNQEFRRMAINAVVDERALREIYLPAFEKAVKEAHPWTVMCAYNRLNGAYCSEHEQLLNDILRQEWGFEGLIISDWGAVNQRVDGLQAGLDLEMPGGKYENDEKIAHAIEKGELEEAILERSARRVLDLVFKSVQNRKDGFQYDEDRHHALARWAAAECIVLLKNEEKILPLAPSRKIAVIGDFAKKPRYQGYGSSVINPTRLDNAFDEMVRYINDSGSIRYEDGFVRAEATVNPEMESCACQAAGQADVVIVFLGLPELYETEGIDRDDMRLPDNQNHLMQELAKVTSNIVVVLSNGSPVEMPWVNDAKGIVEAYLGGQAGGGAIADVLFGKVNPSGKLAETFPLKLEDNPSYDNFPGGPQTVEYRESIYVGYRYYDKVNSEVLFPFGYGLSYTEFTYDDLQINPTVMNPGATVEVSCTVSNCGERAGKEVVQVYVGRSDTSGFNPVRELRDFKKISLQPAETQKVTFYLNKRAFAYYDTRKKDWQVACGEYQICIGTSSRDLRLVGRLVVDQGEDPATTEIPLPETVYAAIQDNHFEQAAFQGLYGKSLPNNSKADHSKLTLNTPLIDFKSSFWGKLVFAIMHREFRKQAPAGENILHERMVEKIMLEAPLQNLTNLSNGALTEKTAIALVHLSNGEILSAIKKLIKN
jgi:beta-glucosidase